VPRRNSNVSLSELDDEDADDGPALHIFSSPIGGGGAIGRLLSRMFGNARALGGGPPGADAPTHRGRGGASGRNAAVSLAAYGAVRDANDTAEQWALTYPEWDVHRRRYRPDWCTVIEVAPKLVDGATVESSDTHALRRALARLGVGLERRHRQMQGDDIDIDAAVEARVETIAGAAADDAVYIDSVRARRDLSVLLLLDISGSAAEPSATGPIVHELQRRAAAALASALNSLGDRVAMYAFRSQGRTAVQIVPVKRFEEPLDATTTGRLGGLVPGAYTRLGAAIRHGSSVLEREGGTPRRLLVVLSDGFAYDHGYEGAYGEADARRALAEARRRGTGCICLSIGAVTDAQALRRVFGTAAHATIPRTEQLPFIVAPLFRSALQSSEQQRRVAQRKERTRERLLIDRRTG
jgi:nitric oxide reductase activation protein